MRVEGDGIGFMTSQALSLSQKMDLLALLNMIMVNILMFKRLAFTNIVLSKEILPLSYNFKQNLNNTENSINPLGLQHGINYFKILVDPLTIILSVSPL